jgi:ABC-type branched-subunit amino acid transport system ATPase component
MAILYAVTPQRYRTLPAAASRFIDGIFGRVRISNPIGMRSRRSLSTVPSRATSAGDLTVDGLEVRFGGLLAVDGVSLNAPGGHVTGLIGPNGAGKTTVFNACTGLVKPAHGKVALAGADVSRRGPAARARTGLGRTFQNVELFEALTVRENVEAGAEGVLAGANPITQLLARPGQRRQVRDAAVDAMRLCNISELAEVPVSTLSTGQRRLVELARCLAGPFQMLLLDEPSSGLDPAETEQFGAILAQVVAEHGVGILLVEHDMSLVLDICEHIYVLDFGELIFEGSAGEVVTSPIVKAAYLGDAEVEAAVAPGHQVEGVA